MKTRVRFAAIVAVLGLLIGVLTERFLAYGLSFDALLTLRHAIFGDRHPAEMPQVVVVNIDEATFDVPAFDKPFALWAPQIATVLDAIDGARAKIIGVDLIFATTVETEPALRGHDWPLRASLGRLSTEDRVVLAETDAGGKVFRPHEIV